MRKTMFAMIINHIIIKLEMLLSGIWAGESRKYACQANICLGKMLLCIVYTTFENNVGVFVIFLIHN